VQLLGLFDLIVWLLVLELLAFSALPFLAWMAPNAPDRGYSLSKVTGLFLFAATCWVLSVCGLSMEGGLLIKTVFALILMSGVWGYRAGLLSVSELRELLTRYGRSVEGVFIGLSLFYLIIRFMNPEIFWGEKPMDLTFLGFFVRNHELPPQDPWAAGSPMSYYYVGIYYVAALLKLTGISVSVGYNLAIATLAGFIGASLYGLFLLVTKRVWFATSAASLLVLASDPELLRLILFEGKPITFDTYWASTRVFTPPCFFEYTSWSLLFADLHAHVIAIPFTVTVTALAAVLFVGSNDRFTGHGIALRCLLGAMLGSLFGINTWDFISFGGVVGLLVVLASIKPFWEPPKNQDGTDNIGEVVLVTLFTRAIALVWDLLFVGMSAGLIAWLYQRGVNLKQAAGWGWVVDPEFNSFHMYVRVLGYWMLGTTAGLLFLGGKKVKLLKIESALGVIGAVCVMAVVLGAPIMSFARDIGNQPWAMIAYCTLIVGAAYFVLWSHGESAERRLTAVAVAVPAYLVIVTELFYLIDRMNTLFKGWMAVWMLSGISTMLILFFVGSAISKSDSKKLKKTFKAFVIVFVSLHLIGTACNVFATVILKRVPVRHYTLDGTAFLPDLPQTKEDAQIVAWLNENVKGMATVLEAHGDPYREFTRISMYTGLPTILGWEHHTRQRGLSSEALTERKKAIRAIYSSDDLDLTKNLLVEYKIDFVVVGNIERANNRPFQSEKFDEHPELFTKVVTFGGTSLYVTYFSKYNKNYKSERPS
jgi:YYY domain-containing protein